MTMTTIQMPDGIVLDDASYSTTFGRFVIQPLEKGYGVTIGNSFRRVLLSSLTGSAIVAVRIDGVMHEFSTIHGVVEDVTEIVLNLKEIRLKPINPKANKITISLRGPHTFTAADIQAASPEFEILNPEQYICTLGSEAKFDFEIRIGRGRGYVPADENKLPDHTIGIIPVDAIFTPIKNVRYVIEPTRVGGSTDYDKLTLEISTDGSITPEDALSQAAQILLDHVQMFINFDISKKDQDTDKQEDDEVSRVRKILLTTVDELELSVRSHNCLKAANIKTLADLVRREEAEMLKFRNFGRKSLSELHEIVEQHGLTFGMDVEKYLKDYTPQEPAS
ncbi:MAG: DNA-directed RNA polymerase subunit alpha [Ignavibacteriae bacterium]|nr:DNA-directed RNA polymerase subunit alpha [Ignavibacteriota bacterium]